MTLEYVYEINAGVLRRYTVHSIVEDAIYTKNFQCSLDNEMYFATAEEAVAHEYKEMQEEVESLFREMEDAKATYEAVKADLPPTLEAFSETLESTFKWK